MKVGDLIRHPHGTIGVVMEPYDTPKGLWIVCWFTDARSGFSLEYSHKDHLEVISEGG